MIRYKMASIAAPGRRRGSRVLLSPITAPIGMEVAYLKVIRTMLAGIRKAIYADVLPVVAQEIASRAARPSVTLDALTLDIDSATFERIKQLGSALGRIATSAAANILGLTAKQHTKKFMASAKRALAIDLSAVVRDEDLEEYLRDAATKQAALITNISDQLISRIQAKVVDAVTQGIPAAELRKSLVEDFKFSDKRAKVVARDQIAKVSSDLERIRSQQAGLDKYIWRTSKDERVRPRHKKCDGKEYEYGKPTDAEEGRPPGQPILCRCVAQGIVEF